MLLKRTVVFLLFVLFSGSVVVYAQENSSAVDTHFLQKGDTIHPIEVRDLKNKPYTTPSIGEKVLLIFYPDPDNPSENDYFVEQTKQWKFPLDKFHAYGIVNLKDTPYPNGIIRFMIRMLRKRSKREAGALILTDPKGVVQTEWNTGDCNNHISVLVVDKTGEVIFWKAGPINEEETAYVIDELVKRLPEARKLTAEELKAMEIND
ncbi:YtfJ family protein [Flammeovirga agarivorans]|uniref:Thioredoxin domain-containing protein n=1 Tax=Flammeovirga agarivorans TaxID=2726742 RepID=A0A7X8SJY7_9BACT|nr:YtfJ family protein [Flammeovirga agarivorans]NLR91601.1 hypothetical protein [Flammeovirga agarivorans]